MRFKLFCLLAVIFFSVQSAAAVDLPRFPSISPDGKTIAFSWHGDLWKVSTKGGTAIRLTAHPQDDLRSSWSPDGEHIAFSSLRSGYVNLFMMTKHGTDIDHVSKTDRSTVLSGWGTDETGQPVLTFSSRREGDVYVASRPYMISPTGGEIRRMHDAFGDWPVVSPDGKRVAFVRGGSDWDRRHRRGPDTRDIWLYNRENQTFRQLTSWEGNDGRPQWIDNNTLVFKSDRAFNTVNLFKMKITDDSPQITRLTHFEVDDVIDFDVSANGKMVVFVAWNQLYRLKLGGMFNHKPEPIHIIAPTDTDDRYITKRVDREVTEAALSPDGQVMATVAYGQIFIRNIDKKTPSVRITEDHARNSGIAWSADGTKLYFTSDVSGTQSIYAATVALTRKDIREQFNAARKAAEKAESETNVEDQPVPEKTMHDDSGKAESEDEVEQVQADGNDDNREPKQTGGQAGNNGRTTEDKPATGDKVDGKATEKGDSGAQFTLDPTRWHDAIRFVIEPVLLTRHNDSRPSPSPDGKYLAFCRAPGSIMLMELATGNATKLHEGWSAYAQWAWSGDSRYLAFAQPDYNSNSDVWVVPIDLSSKPVNVTKHPVNDYYPSWSADNKVLSFVSERVSNQFDLYQVYLDKDLEALSSYELNAYYEEAAKQARKRKPLPVPGAKKKEESTSNKDKNEESENSTGRDAANKKDDKTGDTPQTSIAAADQDKNGGKQASHKKAEDKKPRPIAEASPLDLEDAYMRLKRMTRSTVSDHQSMITPAGDRLLYVNSGGLYSMKWNGTDVKRLAGNCSIEHVTLTGDKVVIVENREAKIVPVNGGTIDTIGLDHVMRIDLAEQSSYKFLEIARVLGEYFYHPQMKGLDWPALTEKYHELAQYAYTDMEFEYVANRFIGELNASHLAVYKSRSVTSNQRYGRLGAFYKRVEEGYRVEDIVAESPAALGKMALQVGDVITEIDFKPFGANDTVESHLLGRVGQETIVTVQRPVGDETRKLHLVFTPISYGDFNELRYREYEKRCRDYTHELSGGRLGYLHIARMNQDMLDEFERDLYAAAEGKDALIIDVRNNPGGWITDRLLASIMTRDHAYTIPRGMDPSITGGYPQDRLFIQRYTMPANALCNEKSFSNAEIFSHAFKTLGRGTLVGETTAGGVISTGMYRLIDGTNVRLPFRGWYLPDGSDMENNGAQPDIIVPQTPEDEVIEFDRQLKTAVEDLLKRLPAKKE